MGPILECVFGAWSPGIGDRGAAAWIIVGAYLLAAALGFRAAGRARGVERTFWILAGLYLAALAINKQLDLQTLMTDAGRCAARLQGWYADRRSVQVAVIQGLILGSIAAGLAALWVVRGTLPRTGIALLGLVWITGYVLVRAVGFHHMDRMLSVEVLGPLRFNWLSELGGIAVFALGAVLASARRGQRPTAT